MEQRHATQWAGMPAWPTVGVAAIEAIVGGEHGDPFAVLGPHAANQGDEAAVAVRAFLPDVSEADVVPGPGGPRPAALWPMARLHPAGFFEAVFPCRCAIFPYRLQLTYAEGPAKEVEDPYRFPSTLSDFDLHLLGEGAHYRAYEKMGAHPTVLDGVAGLTFSVWAPNARRVSVVGDFNQWDGRRHPMRLHPGNGIWEIFLPGLGPGTLYKFEVLPGSGGPPMFKADPFAFAFELPPRTASVVADLTYAWGDREWMVRRAARNAGDAPIAIYEVHLGSWRRGEGGRFLTYRELAHALAPYVKELGYTHVEVLPITEHPFYGSWGYQTIGYFAPTRRFGSPQDFMYFVDYLHQHGIGVIMDWVPAHFPRDSHGLAYFDGTHLYEHADPRQREHPEWGTRIFNYGRHEVANFLLGNALFWLDRYHIDFGLLYAWHENFILPLSHDEVVYGKGSLHRKMPGDDWQKFANLRCFYTFMYGHPGKKLLCMGGEFGQTNEWYHEVSLDWHLLDMGPYHRGLQRLVQDLNGLYRSQPALHQVDFDPAGFQWIDCTDWEGGAISFVRRGRDLEDTLIFACNFTPVVRRGYRIGVPRSGFYRELLNTDSELYGGSNVGNTGGVMAEPIPCHGHDHSLLLTLPPLAALVLRPEGRG